MITGLTLLMLLYVGGRPGQIARIRAAAERHGAVLLHHDGGIEERCCLLPGLVSRADAVLFPVDCISHAAMSLVKRSSRQADKPFPPLRSRRRRLAARSPKRLRVDGGDLRISRGHSEHTMKLHPFGGLPPVSTLTLGGGGLGMVWGATTFEECVATVHEAVAAGINLLDLAPRYGDGKAEEVVGAAFDGRLPDGVRVTSKCGLGEQPADQIDGILRRSIEASLKRLRLARLDLFFLHSNVVPDAAHLAHWPDAAARMTLYRTFVDHVRPAFERFVAEGVIGAWGLTGIGHPDAIIKLLGERPAPAAVQCIANLLDSPGALKLFDGPAKPRDIIRTARANGVGMMGIRAVQAGALTNALDRPLPDDHPEMRDYVRAAGFRRLADELDTNPAILAHRYALSLDVDTLVLGVKNRKELADCVAAAEAGPLPVDLIARVDGSIQDAEARPSRPHSP